MSVRSAAGVPDTVSVIMPTLARARRATALHAALRSVLAQVGVRAVPIVVVNGPEREPRLIDELARRTDLRLVTLPEPDLPGALFAGRVMVDTPWFAELDDDELLLPDALRRRLDCMQADGGADVVVSNGIARRGTDEHPILTDPHALQLDPMRALTQYTWLAPGGALFRTSAVPPALFKGLPRFLEWTTLAVRLAAQCHLRFLADSTFVHHEDSPDSLWRSRECTLGLPAAMRLLLREEMPTALRRRFMQRLGGACHAAAAAELLAGNMRHAWKLHLQSVSARGGWRYLPFTARLLAGAWRNAGPAA